MMLRARLRPIFFRVGVCVTATSGWIDKETQDIWAATEDVRALMVRAMQEDPMTASMLSELRSGREDGLILVPHAVLALTLGERIEFTREVDMYPDAVLERHERAVVGRRDKLSGATELFLENHHLGLGDTNNCVSCCPHRDTELLECIRPYTDQWTSKAFVNLSEYTTD